MRAAKLLSALVAVAVLVGFSGLAVRAQSEQEKMPDIVDTAVKAENFKTLVAALKAAELVETLKGEGPFTVFAPDDAAFNRLSEGMLDRLLEPESKERLASILKYHVASGKLMAEDVMGMETCKTLEGNEIRIRVKEGKVYLDSAMVKTTDIECSNGVIHVIDTVLMPRRRGEWSRSERQED